MMKTRIFAIFFTGIFLFFGITITAQGIEEKPKKINKTTSYSKVQNFNLSFLANAGDLGDLLLDEDFDGKNYLLIIAIDKYKYWKSLNNPVKDAMDFKKVLMERYGFEAQNIYELLNEEATPDNIREQFDVLKNKGTNADKLVIYYSGHGFYDPAFDLGYWVPSEGRTNSGATASYIPNDHIRNYIKAMEFRHVFMIADACFSGALFADDKRGENSEEESMSVKSRFGLSSGNLELVSDGKKGENSPFARYLIAYLRENLQDKVKAEELAKFVKENVENTTEQTPIKGELSGVGSEGGVFVFELQGKKEVTEEEKSKTKK